MAVCSAVVPAHRAHMESTDLFAQWVRAAGGSEQTLRLRLHYLNRLTLACPGRDPLALTADDLLCFVARSGWAPETRKSARASLRAFYRWAADTGRIEQDPTANLPAVRVPPALPHPAPEDVYRAALAMASPRDRRMLLLAGSAGLRRAEIARVHTDHLEDDCLRVVGKGGRLRVVPLHPDLADDLRSLPRGWVFPGRKAGPMSPESVGAVLKRLLGPDWSGHALRHRFASLAYSADRDIRAVQSLLGHASVVTTQRYTAVPDGALRSAALAASVR